MIVEVCHVSESCFGWTAVDLGILKQGPEQTLNLHAQSQDDLDELVGLLLVHGLAFKITYSLVKPKLGWWIRPCK
jgi:hypothetical protein